jgi:hypothetical protein
MDGNPEYERNSATYHRLKAMIRQNYPRGWFVGIADDQVVGASSDFHDLESQLRSQGKDPRRVLVVEAGIDYPENVTIFI